MVSRRVLPALFCSVLVLSAGCASLPWGSIGVRMQLESMMNDSVSAQQRAEAAETSKGRDSPEANALRQELRAIDQRNVQRLDQIIAAHGWPKLREVGVYASVSAYLIVHSASLPDQKRYLPLIRQAVAEHQLPADNIAMLEDKILRNEGKKQLYGTQLKKGKSDCLEPYPVSDEKHLDQRRKALGLTPVAEYVQFLGTPCAKSPRRSP